MKRIIEEIEIYHRIVAKLLFRNQKKEKKNGDEVMNAVANLLRQISPLHY